MTAILVQLPGNPELLTRGSTSAAPSQMLARWAVDREREEIRRFGEIGIPVPMHQKVDQYGHVHEAHREQDDVEGLLIFLRPSAGILLRTDQGIEVLILRIGENVGRRGAVIPKLHERCVDGGCEKGTAGHNGKSFGHRWRFRIQCGFGEDELGEKPSIGAVAIKRAVVERDACEGGRVYVSESTQSAGGRERLAVEIQGWTYLMPMG